MEKEREQDKLCKQMIQLIAPMNLKKFKKLLGEYSIVMMRYAPLPGVRINREKCPKCGQMRDVASWWVSISGYEHVEHKCLECSLRWPNFVKGDHQDLLRAVRKFKEGN